MDPGGDDRGPQCRWGEWVLIQPRELIAPVLAGDPSVALASRTPERPPHKRLSRVDAVYASLKRATGSIQRLARSGSTMNCAFTTNRVWTPPS